MSMNVNLRKDEAVSQTPQSPEVHSPGPRTNDEKAFFLTQETGMELVIAEEFLASNGWQLNEALKGYRDLVEHESKSNKTAPETQSQLAVAETDKRKVSRGFSVSNLKIVQEEREKQKQAVSEINKYADHFEILENTKASFVLPDISMHDKDVVNIIKNDLISKITLQILTNAGRLNWWSEVGACRKLFPLSTVGDGNCLLHAVSLGMWGFHDRMLTLRKALYKMLSNPLARKALKRRWKYDLWKENMKSGGLTYTREEWEEEWETVVKLSCDRPRKIDNSSNNSSRRISRQFSRQGSGLEEGESLDSLEAIHVYVLANLICRPIIIVAEEMLKDADGRPVAPIPFGGIYLPLEQDIDKCYKYPLVLAYETSHFSALVPADGDNIQKGEKVSSSVPLVDRGLYLLPIKYAIDPGSTWDMVQDDSMKEEKPELVFGEKVNLLRKYLDVVKVPFKSSKAVPGKAEKDYTVGSVFDHVHDMFIGQPSNMIVTAKLNIKNRPKHYVEMIDNFLKNVKEKARQQQALKKMCSKCTDEANPSLNGLCMKCSEKNKVRRTGSKGSIGSATAPPLCSDRMLQRSNAVNIEYDVTDRLPLIPSQAFPSTNIQNKNPQKSNCHSIQDGIYKTTVYQVQSTDSLTNQGKLMNKSSNTSPTLQTDGGTFYYPSNQPVTRPSTAQHSATPRSPNMSTNRTSNTANPSVSTQYSAPPRSPNMSTNKRSTTANPSESPQYSATPQYSAPRSPNMSTNKRPTTANPSASPQYSAPRLPDMNTNKRTTIANPLASPRTPDEEYNRIGTQCRASGCKFYGNNQTLGFCSSCYRQYNNKSTQR